MSSADADCEVGEREEDVIVNDIGVGEGVGVIFAPVITIAGVGAILSFICGFGLIRAILII